MASCREPEACGIFLASERHLDPTDVNKEMRRPMALSFGVIRVVLFAILFAWLDATAARWVLFIWSFAFSVGFAADLLFGMVPASFAGGMMIGAAKWLGLSIAIFQFFAV